MGSPRSWHRSEHREAPGEIVLIPTREEPTLREKDGLLVFSGQTTEDLLEAVDENRRERVRKLSAPESQ